MRTRTDNDGVTHRMFPIPPTLKDVLFNPIIEASKRAFESQLKITTAMAAEGVDVKPIPPDNLDSPDFHPVCDMYAWVSENRLDPEPQTVTCIECLAVPP